MKGSIGFDRKWGRFYVSWYHRPHRKTYKIYYYKGIVCETKGIGQKLLSAMQAREEMGIFRIEEFIGTEPSDVVPFLYEWLGIVRSTLKPNTYRAYLSRIENHLSPFFRANPYQLKEIQYDVILKFLNSESMQRVSGSTRKSVMIVLSAALGFAWRSQKILTIPPFPKRKQFQIIQKPIRWLPEMRQIAIIVAVPIEHQPIYWWMKYHFRRPSEACALLKKDFTGHSFILRHNISGGQLVESLKTGDFDEIPMHREFKPWLEKMWKFPGPFFFCNPKALNKEKRYTWDCLSTYWHKACQQVGEKINLYNGMKHSSCSQALNEKGLNTAEVQLITGHKSMDSVHQYTKVEMATRKALMEVRTIPHEKRRAETE